MTLFGYNGYYVFFRVLELLGREFDENNPGCVTFSQEYFFGKFAKVGRKAGSSTVRRILEFYVNRDRFIVEYLESKPLDKIKVKCPKFEELADEYTIKLLKQKAGQKSNSVSHQEVEEKEPEKKKVKIEKEKPSVPIFYGCEFFQITQEYHQELVREFPMINLPDLYVRLKNYCVDNPLRYKKNIRGHLKNLRNVLRDWCLRAKPTLPQPQRPFVPMGSPPPAPLPDESERLKNGEKKISELITSLVKEKTVTIPTDNTERRRLLEDQKRELGIE